jgi:hypothetical protein
MQPRVPCMLIRAEPEGAYFSPPTCPPTRPRATG